MKIKTFQEAIQSLETVQHFLESQGLLLQQVMSIGDAVDDVTGLKLASSTQTTLHDYFLITGNSNIYYNIIITINTSVQCNKLTHNHCAVDYNMIIFMLCHCVVDYSDIQ